jgi:hypothetical protein
MDIYCHEEINKHIWLRLLRQYTIADNFQNYTSRIFSSGKKSRISLHILTPIRVN